MSAEQLRARAAEHDARGSHAEAFRDTYRAMARSAEERQLLDAQTGRTATEIALTLGDLFGDHESRLREAAENFSRSVYGRGELTRGDYEQLQQLDQQLTAAAPHREQRGAEAGGAPMTAAASAATAAGLGTAARGLIARWQFWIILLLIGAAVAAAVQLLAEDEAAPYGLSSTELNGYGALAAVLEDEGITLQQARSGQEARDLMDQTGDAGVVVMLPPNSARSPEDQLADQLMDQAAAGEREALWIVGDAWTVQQLSSGLPQDVLDLETGPAGTAPEIPAGEQCGLGPAQAAETIQAPGVGLLTDDGCFPLDPEGHLLAETERGMVLGVPEALTNQHITAAGNAALALGLAETLASEDGDLIWYTPSAEDAAGQQEQLTPGEVLDDWMLPVLAWLIVAGLIGAVAAGRRDGPVVVEPLPAEVHAGELAEGRARLYQRADARAEAAEALRTGTLRRLGRTLRLGARPAPENVVTAAARRTGRDQHELAALLQHPRAGSSPELVAYAQALHQLEQQTAVVETATEENR